MDTETLPNPPERPHDPPLRAPVVWVTRTQDGAERTARAIRELGAVPVIAPVMEARPVSAHIAPDSFDVLILTSGNAVNAFCDMSERRDMPTYCVGNRTAEVATIKGVRHAKSANGDVSALFKLICDETPKSARLLYASPHDPAAPLTQWLKDEGYAVEQVTVYETQVIDQPLADDDLRRVTHVLIHSPRAGQATAQFLIRRKPDVHFETLTFVCISEQAWHAAHDELLKQDGGAEGENSPVGRLIRRISAFPDEASMLSLLG